MILKAILRVQLFCSFGTMLLIIKTDSTVICVSYMLEHVWGPITGGGCGNVTLSIFVFVYRVTPFVFGVTPLSI